MSVGSVTNAVAYGRSDAREQARGRRAVRARVEVARLTTAQSESNYHWQDSDDCVANRPRVSITAC
jgi:hypothetical protein